MADKSFPRDENQPFNKRVTVLNQAPNTRQRLSEGEDRLSSLPDFILIDILSRLEIQKAAATSVLSHRWRYLWTGVTSLDFMDYTYDFAHPLRVSTIILHILRQLTCPKLKVITIGVHFGSLGCAKDIVNLCRREFHCQNLEHIRIYTDGWLRIERTLIIPPCMFRIKTLVTLDLTGDFAFPENLAVVQLPKLKNLFLGTFDSIPFWFGTFLSSCPLLEHLKLRFDLYGAPQQYFCLQILCPNLKSLFIAIWLESRRKTPHHKIFINTPALTELDIHDSTSWYYFVEKPTALNNAIIRSTFSIYKDEELGLMAVNQHEDYLRQMAKFVAGMSSVCHLQLKVCNLKLYHNLEPLNRSNIYTHLLSLNHHGPLPLNFPNLASLRTTFDGVGLNGWKDLLLSLHCFPRLNHLEANMKSDDPPEVLEHNNWSAPDSIPACLVNQLKKIDIAMNPNLIVNELKFIAYILNSAHVLEKLFVSVRIQGKNEKDALWDEQNCCRSLFELPRGSSTCEIVFLGGTMTASSNDFQIGRLTCHLSDDLKYRWHFL